MLAGIFRVQKACVLFSKEISFTLGIFLKSTETTTSKEKV